MFKGELTALYVLCLASEVAWLGVLLAEEASKATLSWDCDKYSFCWILTFFLLKNEWRIDGKPVEVVLQEPRHAQVFLPFVVQLVIEACLVWEQHNLANFLEAIDAARDGHVHHVFHVGPS